ALQRTDPETFPNALATMFFRVEDDPARVRQVLDEWVAPTLGRATEELGERLLAAPAEACAERLIRYAEAGVQRLFLWPVGDPIEQLQLFCGRGAPVLGARPPRQCGS